MAATNLPADLQTLKANNVGVIGTLEELPDGVMESVYEEPPSYDAANIAALDVVFEAHGIPKIYEFTKSDGTKKVYNIWEDLRAVMSADIYVVVDDSGSMTAEVKDGKGLVIGTRWDELKETLRGVIEMAVALDRDGITVHFLNRGRFDNVKSLAELDTHFAQGPGGYTPLTAVCKEAMDTRDKSKHLLLLVTTDGEPNYITSSHDKYATRDVNGAQFKELIAKRNNDPVIAETSYVFVNILACTDNDKEIGWLNALDIFDATLDVLDDYHSEKQQVKGVQGMKFKYTKGMHLGRFFLGAFFKEYDEMDEQA